MSIRTGRAAPLPPEERRDALIAVFLRLTRRDGRVPSTSDIAIEADVAEGTIYRVFPTKDALVTEAVQVAFCPGPVQEEILAIRRDQPMRGRLVDFTTIAQRRFTDVFALMSALGLHRPPTRDGHEPCCAAGRHVRGGQGETGPEPPQQPPQDAISSLLVGEDGSLAIPARDVIHRLRLLTFSASHPGIADGRLLTPDEIVDTILDGVRCRDERCASPVGTNRLTLTPHESLPSTCEEPQRKGHRC